MRVLSPSLVCLAVLLLVQASPADEPSPMTSDDTPNIAAFKLPQLDIGKGRIERPIEALLAVDPNAGQVLPPNGPPAGLPQPLHRTPEFVPKKKIEAPVKRVLTAASLEVAFESKVAPPPANNDAAQPARNLDGRKGVIEAPVKAIVADTNDSLPAPEVKVDERKSDIEGPIKAIAAPVNTNVQLDEEIVDAATDESPEDNPHVEPGKVTWHDDFAAACTAAKRSGKPVLLFHLMGQLDERFT